MCRSIISLSRIAYEMWHDHSFSQRNRTAERAVELGVGGDREERGVGQTWLGNIGGRVFIK